MNRITIKMEMRFSESILLLSLAKTSRMINITFDEKKMQQLGGISIKINLIKAYSL